MLRNDHHRTQPRVSALLNRLAAKEDAFLGREFLAPALRGGVVRVRIGGAVCRVRFEPADFEGYGVFHPISHSEAILDRRATLAERRGYLRLFPLVRLIACRRVGDRWQGSAASFGDSRVRLQGLAPIMLAKDVQRFDVVRCRFDGSHFWFEDHDARHDLAASAYLRASLEGRAPPEDLDRKALTAEARAAYELNYWTLVDAESKQEAEPGAERAIHPRLRRSLQRKRAKRRADQRVDSSDPSERRLRNSLSHAGAELVDYLERADGFRVRYMVQGRRFTSSVNKHDLTVQAAGVCLNGEDQKFDLGSLVGVLREGQDLNAIYEF